MIKFSGYSDKGRLFVGLGISALNVDKLKEGQPIIVKGNELGFDADIMIFYGETEEEMENQLRNAGITIGEQP